MYLPSHYTIRPAVPSDSEALRRLAALDSQRPLSGDSIVGVDGGEIVAAMTVDGLRIIADPFRPTAYLVTCLRHRAHAIRAARGTPSRRERILARLKMRGAPAY